MRIRGQWEKIIGGWTFMFTVGQGWGLGFAFHSSLWNGVTFFLGPVIFDLAPPLPKKLRDSFTPPL